MIWVSYHGRHLEEALALFIIGSEFWAAHHRHGRMVISMSKILRCRLRGAGYRRAADDITSVLVEPLVR